MATARAAAVAHGLPLYRYLGGVNAATLPVPCLNVLNGGKHADNTVDFQEFMIAPHNAPSFAEAIRKGIETFHILKSVLKKKNYSTAVGDEGGFAPDLKSNEEAVEVILEAITKAGYRAGEDISICLDPAASEMWEDGKYVLFKSTRQAISSESMVKMWESWARQYPIILLEDGMGENDWEGWKILTDTLGSRVELVGDDIFYDPTGREEQLPLLRIPQVGRNRGYLHRGPYRGDRRGTHQDRFRMPQRAHSQVQSVFAH